jgi:T5SS/PEP-CTERM-associated repeat protein
MRRRTDILSGLIAFSFIFLPARLHAQLVDDGSSYTLDGVATNVTGGIIVGTNGSFTTLILTNGATITNSTSGYVGVNTSATSNSVIVTGSGSSWSTGIGFFVGQSGSFNQLWITDSGMVSDSSATIGQNNSASNNLVWVSGVGSLWTNSTAISVGDHGNGNQLIVTNGGTVVSLGSTIGGLGMSNLVIVAGTNSFWRTRGISILGTSPNASYNGLVIKEGGKVWNSSSCTIGSYSQTNFVLVTDPGTQWTNASYISLGGNGHGSQLVVSNGASVLADYTTVENNGGSLQQLVVTGPNSLLTNRSDFYLGQAGFSNRLVVVNGGTLAANNGYISWQNFAAGANDALVADPNSIWTNRADLFVGYLGPRSHLIVSNGAKVFNAIGHVGESVYSSNNSVVVTGPGSLWSSHSYLYLGGSGSSNQLAIYNGGTVVTENCYVGSDGASSNDLVTIDGGNLIVTNGTLTLLKGAVVLNSGLLRAGSLSVINKGMGKLFFNGGLLQTVNTTALFNGAPFLVGNGIDPAAYELMLPGGGHRFSDGLVISSNALLTGFGAILGNVRVASGGTIAPATNNTISYIPINGALTLSNSSKTVMNLNASSGAASHLDGLTNVTYGGTLQLSNVSGLLAQGNSFKLFNSTHYTGAFELITPATPGPGLKWNTNQLSVDGTLRVFSTNTAPPSFASAHVSGSSFLLTVTGGIPYDPVVLLTKTNLQAPNWVYLQTNLFNSNGLAVISIPFSPSDSSRFFSVQVD